MLCVGMAVCWRLQAWLRDAVPVAYFSSDQRIVWCLCCVVCLQGVPIEELSEKIGNQHW
jgi:hypothetical protein